MANKREKRSLAERIFGKKKEKKQATYDVCKLLNSWLTVFTPYGGNAYSQAQVRTAVHAFAKRAALVKPRHVQYDQAEEVYKEVKNSPLHHLLCTKPNETATAYKMFYRLAVQYKLYNNAFLYPVYEMNKFTKREEIKAIYNINASSIELVEYEKEIFCIFEFNTTGERYIVPYCDVIHVVGHCNENDIFGDSNKPINSTLKTGHSLKQSVEKYAELSQVLRGILTVQNGVTKDSDLAAARDKFIENNLKMDSDTGGIIVTDGKYKYEQLKGETALIPTTQLKFVKEEIFEYYGANERIVRNEATPEEENSYYNGELMPFFEQLEQALTAVLCRDNTEMRCASSRLYNATLKDKTDTLRYITSVGGATLDTILDVLGLPLVGGADGKRRVQSLNYAAADIVDSYQTKKPKKEEKGGKEDADEEKEE